MLDHNTRSRTFLQVRRCSDPLGHGDMWLFYKLRHRIRHAEALCHTYTQGIRSKESSASWSLSIWLASGEGTSRPWVSAYSDEHCAAFSLGLNALAIYMACTNAIQMAQGSMGEDHVQQSTECVHCLG